MSEQLEYVPASLFILEHVRPKYACPCCQEHVAAAAPPAKVIAKGIPGQGLIAHILTSKYCDHLPLYRQEFMLARHGVCLSRKTLCGWGLTAADKLQPLIDLMKREVLASRVLHTDDTPVRVQGNGKAGPFTGRFWVHVGTAPIPTRSMTTPPAESATARRPFWRDTGAICKRMRLAATTGFMSAAP